MREYDLVNHQLISQLFSGLIAIILAILLAIGMIQTDTNEKKEEQLTIQDAYRSLVVIAQECKRYNDLEFPDNR